MSIKAFGSFEFNKKINMTNSSFDITSIAVKHKLGIKLGGNATSFLIKSTTRCEERISYELIDDPMDVNAQCLFSGDNIEVTVNGKRVDNGESLRSRLFRVQQFFMEIIEKVYVDKIVLNINIEMGDEFEILEININDISDILIKMYESEGNWTPSVRLVINS